VERIAMSTNRPHLRDESGFTLASGMLMLVLLTGLGTYAITLTQVETTLAASVKTARQALYLADAGLERGRALVAASTAVPPLPAATTASLGGGTYAITFPHIFPTTAAFEYNVTVQAVGTQGTASKTLQAQVTKTFALADAALSIRGNEADSSFTGNAFAIDGRDYHHVTEALTGGVTYHGITVQSTARLNDVDGALTAQMKDNVIGLPGQGTTASIGVSAALPSSTITSLADALCNAAPAAQKITIPLIGSYSPPNNAAWGTRATPKIHCVTGVGVPGTMSVDISGNFEGVGVLVVRDADLVASGAFHFEGLIIVTGDKVGFGLKGGGNKEIYGSIMINETDYDGPSYREDLIQGASVVRYSQSALAMARQLTPSATLSSLLSTFPVSVQQRAWREVTP
jgi:hypothetical protein